MTPVWHGAGDGCKGTGTRLTRVADGTMPQWRGHAHRPHPPVAQPRPQCSVPSPVSLQQVGLHRNSGAPPDLGLCEDPVLVLGAQELGGSITCQPRVPPLLVARQEPPLREQKEGSQARAAIA